MRVYTFWKDCGVTPDSGWILDQWHRRWKEAGYEPVILTEADALAHPKYHQYKAIFSKFPTVNPPDYELQCFLRWLPMSLHGGMMVDVDLFPMNFPPEKAHEIKISNTLAFLCRNRVPCCVIGQIYGYIRMLEWFAEYKIGPRDMENGLPHISDQGICTQHEEVKMFDLVREFGEGRAVTELLHFSNAACKGRKRAAIESVYGK